MASHSRYNYTPKRILSLTSKSFVSGTATGAYVANEGTFFSAIGMNPFVNPMPGSADVGLLQTGSTPTNIGGSTVVDLPIAGVGGTDAVSGKLCILGNAGHFYIMDIAAETVTDARSGSGNIVIPNVSSGSGIGLLKPKGGSAHIYYWQAQQIGQWDLTNPGAVPANWVDNWSTGLQNTSLHPVHAFAALGTLFYGDLDRIGKVSDISGTATNTLDVLDVPSGFVVTCLEDDGTYLVIGITKNISSLTNSGALTKILFWDTFSSSWNKEWILPDGSITCIKKYGTGFLAYGAQSLWYFDFNTFPKRLRPLSTATNVAIGFSEAADSIIDAAFWGGNSATNHVGVYGKLLPSLPAVYSQPFAGLGNSLTSYVNVTIKPGKMFVGTNANKLWSFNLATGGATGVSPQTIYFDLGDIFQVDRIDVVFGSPLASGDDFSISTKTDEATSSTAWGSTTFAADGAIRRKEMKGHLQTDVLGLVLNFNAGNPKIKRIDVYGERVSTI